jgi:TonB-dependent SusC/RagA subfamily outer membrane receptor
MKRRNPLRLLVIGLMLLFSIQGVCQTNVINGKVTDQDGEPLPGTTVMIIGTQTGTTTDFDGNYSLVATPGSVLKFSFIGFKEQEVTVGTSNLINVTMQLSEGFLEEVIVTGYMAERKADLTGSVAVVKMKEVADIPTGNVLTNIQGRVAGMNVVSDGTPGGQGSSSLIRGVTTINNSTPLYVIDGVMTRSDIGTIISSNDIESIQVLKDAASAAIYGAQAANGVIIITTKQAKEGTIKIDFNMTQTLQTFQNNIPLLNAQEWGDVYWAAYQYDYGTIQKTALK